MLRGLVTYLLENGKIEDPFYKMNEYAVTELSRKDCEFFSEFEVTDLKSNTILKFYGLDTVCDVYLNGSHILYAENMHRTYTVDVASVIKTGSNRISIKFHSPIRDLSPTSSGPTSPCLMKKS